MKITENLTLNYIEDNNVTDNKLIVVYISFSLFGQHGEAYLALKNLDGEYASYSMTESGSEIHESFVAAIEDDENWVKIKKAVKNFVEEWEKENIEL